MMGELICISGDYKGAAFPIRDGEVLTIGRNPGKCNVVLPEASVSRLHCALRWAAASDRYTLQDMSSNGVFNLNGARYPGRGPVLLEKGAYIRIASSNNVFRIGGCDASVRETSVQEVSAQEARTTGVHSYVIGPELYDDTFDGSYGMISSEPAWRPYSRTSAVRDISAYERPAYANRDVMPEDPPTGMPNMYGIIRKRRRSEVREPQPAGEQSARSRSWQSQSQSQSVLLQHEGWTVMAARGADIGLKAAAGIMMIMGLFWKWYSGGSAQMYFEYPYLKSLDIVFGILLLLMAVLSSAVLALEIREVSCWDLLKFISDTVDTAIPVGYFAVAAMLLHAPVLMLPVALLAARGILRCL